MCKYRPHWHSLRSEGKLLPYAARQIKTLAFEVHTTTEVDISIYQPSDRLIISSYIYIILVGAFTCLPVYLDLYAPRQLDSCLRPQHVFIW